MDAAYEARKLVEETEAMAPDTRPSIGYKARVLTVVRALLAEVEALEDQISREQGDYYEMQARAVKAEAELACYRHAAEHKLREADAEAARLRAALGEIRDACCECRAYASEAAAEALASPVRDADSR